MAVFVLSLGPTGDSKAGFVDIILNVLKKRKRISPGPKRFVFSLSLFFFESTAVTHGNKMIKTLQGAIGNTGPLDFLLRNVPVVNPQVFQVYRSSYHTTKPAI